MNQAHGLIADSQPPVACLQSRLTVGNSPVIHALGAHGAGA
jgi:hypothetical protein